MFKNVLPQNRKVYHGIRKTVFVLLMRLIQIKQQTNLCNLGCLRVDSPESFIKSHSAEKRFVANRPSLVCSRLSAFSLPVRRPAMDVPPAKYAFFVILLHFQRTDTLYITDSIGRCTGFVCFLCGLHYWLLLYCCWNTEDDSDKRRRIIQPFFIPLKLQVLLSFPLKKHGKVCGSCSCRLFSNSCCFTRGFGFLKLVFYSLDLQHCTVTSVGSLGDGSVALSSFLHNIQIYNQLLIHAKRFLFIIF